MNATETETEGPVEMLSRAKVLDEKTSSVKIVVEIPTYVHDILLDTDNHLDYSLASFFQSAIVASVRQWLDLHFDVERPERLEAMNSIDRLLLARELERSAHSFFGVPSVLKDLAQDPDQREFVVWAERWAARIGEQSPAAEDGVRK